MIVSYDASSDISSWHHARLLGLKKLRRVPKPKSTDRPPSYQTKTKIKININININSSSTHTLIANQNQNQTASLISCHVKQKPHHPLMAGLPLPKPRIAVPSRA